MKPRRRYIGHPSYRKKGNQHIQVKCVSCFVDLMANDCAGCRRRIDCLLHEATDCEYRYEKCNACKFYLLAGIMV